ncbi:MAG: ABC transporter ATP-binding protein/permease [Clostridiales bacterium]|nr:ABC transporter ATP-binding protein/permease [Clostridiales bacterium]
MIKNQGKKKSPELKVTRRITLKKILRYVGVYRFRVALSIILAVATVALTLYIPVLVGQAIDHIIGPGQVDFYDIFTIVIRIGVAAAVTAILQWIMNAINNRVTVCVVRDIRNEAFDRLQILPLKYLDGKPQGDVVSRIIADVDQFSDGLLMGFTQLFTGVVTIAGTLIFMLTIKPLIALVVVALTPVSLLVARFISKRTYDMFRLQSETRAEQTALIDEMVENQKVVRAFSHEDEAMERFDEINGRLELASRRATFFSSLVNPTTRFVNSIVYAAVALTGALSVIFGGMTVGGLTAFLSYANQYTRPFNEISGVITELQNALACAARIFELIETEAETPDDADAADPSAAEGRVDISHVDFSYDPAKRLIEDMDIHVEPGQRIAIVGPTGCGKTTLINLLMRFYDTDKGAIFVDGCDIRRMKRRALRGSYGMVLQDTWLKEGTIRDNIRLGRPEATDDEVIAAARSSHAHGFIRRLPEGYDTVIGEDGGSLSAGERQLLSIARVMLTDPSMLILDEATSSIDTRTEMQVQEAFAKLMEGRTSFIVAHRLSTIRNADCILVMRDGKIVEQGDHDQLMEKRGFYYELYQSQFEG